MLGSVRIAPTTCGGTGRSASRCASRIAGCCTRRVACGIPRSSATSGWCASCAGRRAALHGALDHLLNGGLIASRGISCRPCRLRRCRRMARRRMASHRMARRYLTRDRLAGHWLTGHRLPRHRLCGTWCGRRRIAWGRIDGRRHARRRRLTRAWRSSRIVRTGTRARLLGRVWRRCFGSFHCP